MNLALDYLSKYVTKQMGVSNENRSNVHPVSDDNLIKEGLTPQDFGCDHPNINDLPTSSTTIDESEAPF